MNSETSEPRARATAPKSRSVSESSSECVPETKLQEATASISASPYPVTALTDLDPYSLSLILSFTSPADVCRLASVSKSFAETSLSNTVWKPFLPLGISDVLKKSNCLGDEDSLINESLFDDLENLKFRSVYRVLSQGLSINGGRQKVALDKTSGDFVFHLSVVENLSVVWGDHSNYWWMENGIPGATFTKTAHLLNVCWFQIGGRISCFLPMGKYSCSWRLARDSVHNALNVRRGRGLPLLALPGPGTARGTLFRWNRNKADSKITRYREGDVTEATEVEIDVTSVAVSECARGEWSEVVVGEVTIGREDVRAREDGRGREDGREGEAGFLDMGVELMEVKDGNWKSGLYVDSFVLRQLRV